MRKIHDAPDRGRALAKGRAVDVDESALALIEAAVSEAENAPVEPVEPAAKGNGRKRGKGGG